MLLKAASCPASVEGAAPIHLPGVEEDGDAVSGMLSPSPPLITASASALGLVLASIMGGLLAQRLVVPIQRLQEGADGRTVVPTARMSYQVADGDTRNGPLLQHERGARS